METTQERGANRHSRLGGLIRWWAEAWVLFARSAGGRADDLVGPALWEVEDRRAREENVHA